ncbi:MAG TPA: hypothetical protein VIO38_04815 [Rariglobus sp.]
MTDDQLPLAFDSSPVLQPGPVPHLRDEIARLWGLPLGEQVELFLLRGPCDSLRGRLDLVASPDLPLNPRHPLALSIAGVTFSSRDIDHWKLI